MRLPILYKVEMMLMLVAMLAVAPAFAAQSDAPAASPASVAEAAGGMVRFPVETVHRAAFSSFPMDNVWEMFSSPDTTKDKPLWKWRNDLEDKGIVFTFVYTGEFDVNGEGGTDRDSTYLGNFDMVMDVDSEKLGLWHGGTFHIYGVDNHGGKKLTGEIVGDLQTASNIEAPRTTKLLELWYEQKFFDDHVAALVGLHNLNSDFAVTEYGGLFFNSSFGISPEMSVNVPLSIFPTTALGTRVSVSPCDAFTVLAGVYDGDPQDPDVNDHGTHWALSKKDGAFTIVEAQLHYDLPVFYAADPLAGTLKGGSWYHSKVFDDVAALDDEGLPITHEGNYGGYVILDQRVWKEKDDQGLGVFFQFGAAPQDRNTVVHYYGTGFNYTGLIPGRDADVFGVAYNRAELGAKLRDTDLYLGHESVVEFTYQVQVTPAVVVQPDIQIIHNPGSVQDVKDAVVYTVRFKISF